MELMETVANLCISNDRFYLELDTKETKVDLQMQLEYRVGRLKPKSFCEIQSQSGPIA